MRFLFAALLASLVGITALDAGAHAWDAGPDILAQDSRYTAVRDTDTVFAAIPFASTCLRVDS